MTKEVKFKQIATAFEPVPSGGGNIHIFAVDEEGQLWQWMRGTWGTMKHPTKEVTES
jgi:hypothetical protein